MLRTSIYLLLIFVLCSCNRPPKDVRLVLNAAGDNRRELEMVIDHYKVLGDEDKLKAAYFLIGNMDDKYAIDCEEIKKYDPIFAILDSLKKNKLDIPTFSPFLRAKWDSLVKVNGSPSFNNAQIIPDYSVIKADYLIENIEISFKLREESQWGKKISIEKFFEFVLAHRFSHEPLENWRAYFYEKYKTKLDSINADSCIRLFGSMNNIIPKARWYEIFMAYPYDIPNSKMVNIMKGACSHLAVYNTTAMRSIGLPVGKDFTPLYGDFSRGHDWNVLFLEDGKTLPFDIERGKLVISSTYKPAKIFRKTFGRQDIKITVNKEDVPENLLDNHRIDVTHEYSIASNAVVPLRHSSISKNRYAVICTFNNKNWVPQDYGRIKSGKAFFKNMGTGLVYIVMYYNSGEMIPASDPFILRENGKIDFLAPSPDKTQDMLLLRKFRYNQRTYMINDYFQGANKTDFSDSVKLFTITVKPEKIEKAQINNATKFRYVRYKSSPPGFANVAELEFYGGQKSSDTLLLHGKVIGFPEVTPNIGTPYGNAFDGKLETYFENYKTGLSWAGLDLGEPRRITKIKYCPRSDTNFIQEGDTYDFCYWANGEWISMGIQVAKEQYLHYKNVPSGGLYILHNLTRGKEERIFTYENGKQVFW